MLRSDSAGPEYTDLVPWYLHYGRTIERMLNIDTDKSRIADMQRCPVGQASNTLVELIREKVRHRAMAYPLSVTQIVKSSLGIEAGASVLVLQQANKIFFQMRQNVLARD